MASTKLPLGRALAYWRIQRRISRNELAARLGVQGNYFAKVEGGHRTPPLAKLARICEAMGVEQWRVLRTAQRMAEAEERFASGVSDGE